LTPSAISKDILILWDNELYANQNLKLDDILNANLKNFSNIIQVLSIILASGEKELWIGAFICLKYPFITIPLLLGKLLWHIKNFLQEFVVQQQQQTSATSIHVSYSFFQELLEKLPRQDVLILQEAAELFPTLFMNVFWKQFCQPSVLHNEQLCNGTFSSD